MRSGALFLGLAALAAQQGASPASDPAVAVWYRGGADGRARLDDLVALKVYGFSAVAWPDDRGEELGRIRELASSVGLAVLTPPAARRGPGDWFDVDVSRVPASHVAAHVWLAIADGRRVIAFDAGAARAGPGLVGASGERAAWVAPALALTREIDANTTLIRTLQPGPALELTGGSGWAGSGRGSEVDGARVVLLDAARAWVLIAANPGVHDVSGLARLPKTVPYGPWVSLIDGSNMAMVDRASHHEYRVTLPPGAAEVYVIDK